MNPNDPLFLFPPITAHTWGLRCEWAVAEKQSHWLPLQHRLRWGRSDIDWIFWDSQLHCYHVVEVKSFVEPTALALRWGRRQKNHFKSFVRCFADHVAEPVNAWVYFVGRDGAIIRFSLEDSD